jgi:hypothetical protein
VITFCPEIPPTLSAVTLTFNPNEDARPKIFDKGHIGRANLAEIQDKA